jgi:hypothetical protein
MTGYLELDFLCGADGEIDFLESQGFQFVTAEVQKLHSL